MTLLEIYAENHFEIFDPQNGNQVALFFDKADAEAYVAWRDGRALETEAEWLGNEDDDATFVGTALAVGENGELAIIHADGPKHYVNPVGDIEARNLAAMIDAVLA